MPANFLVYGLTDPRTGEIRYVGKSSAGLSRPRAHRTPKRLAADQTHKGRWIRSLHATGLDYEITVLQECADSDSLVAAEIAWIAEARAAGWPLTNLAAGGEGWSVGMKHRPESIAKTAAAHRGKKNPLITKFRFDWTGHKHSAETRAKMSIALAGNTRAKGNVMTASAREAIARTKTGVPQTAAHAQAIAIGHRRRHRSAVVRFNLLGSC